MRSHETKHYNPLKQRKWDRAVIVATPYLPWFRENSTKVMIIKLLLQLVKRFCRKSTILSWISMVVVDITNNSQLFGIEYQVIILQSHGKLCSVSTRSCCT